MGTKLVEEPKQDAEVYIAQAQLGCSSCGGKIVIVIPKSKVKDSEKHKLKDMPSLDDPRWEVMVSTCRCEDE